MSLSTMLFIKTNMLYQQKPNCTKSTFAAALFLCWQTKTRIRGALSATEGCSQIGLGKQVKRCALKLVLENRWQDMLSNWSWKTCKHFQYCLFSHSSSLVIDRFWNPLLKDKRTSAFKEIAYQVIQIYFQFLSQQMIFDFFHFRWNESLDYSSKTQLLIQS